MNEASSSLKEHFLKHEKVQVFIRIPFVLSFLAVFYYLYFYGGDEWQQLHEYSFAVYTIAPLFVIALNVVYYFFIQHYPFKYQKERLIVLILIDTFFTAYMMYLVGSMSAYYAGVFLWFSVVYAIRYGKEIAYISYATVLFAWIVLINTSPFWLENKAFAIGWLVTLIILPLYNFKLVEALHINIARLHATAQRAEYLATHDRLTGLKNRYAFDEELQGYIDDYYQHGERFAIFFIDLDSFKDINDHHGHDIGDRVLKEAAKRLTKVVENTYRLGGDEFVAIVKYKNNKELKSLAANLLFHLTLPCKNGEIFLAASVGISRYPDDGESEFIIKKHADEAMYQAKQSGKNRYIFYSEVA